MNLIVTIAEPTAARALEAVAELSAAAAADGIELRLDALEDALDFDALRVAVRGLLIVTDRSTPGRPRPFDAATMTRALAAGADFVDVELLPSIDRLFIAKHRARVILSHHDFAACGDVAAIAREMTAHGVARMKIAVTPQTFTENFELLRMQDEAVNELTIIGMGELGLYTRILAPFVGARFAFVAPGHGAGGRRHAPGQLTLDTALAIYGAGSERGAGERPAPAFFAIAGNPATHSLSPTIHNPLFREKSLRAAYSVASVPTFADVAVPFANATPYAPSGLSITAPYKEEALAFARTISADIGDNARDTGAVNTLVRLPDGSILADNTDVDAFSAVLAQLCGRERKSVALIGAGGTARAALAALRRAGMHATVFNRTVARAATLAATFDAVARPLGELAQFDGEIVINTAGTSYTEIPESLLTPARAYIDVDYSGARAALLERARRAGMTVVDGREILHLQAGRQNELFTRALPTTSIGEASAAPLKGAS